MAGRHVGKDAEPAERIFAFELTHRRCRDRLARGAMEAVAADDELRVDPRRRAVSGEGHERRDAVDVVQRDVLRLVQDRQVALRRRVHQVARHLGLAIDGDVLAGERLDVDTDQMVGGGEVEAFLHQPLGPQPLVEAQSFHQVGRHRLQHARTDTAEDIGRRLAFDDHAVDACRAQQMPEQQARGTCADDDDRGLHRADASCLSSASSTR